MKDEKWIERIALGMAPGIGKKTIRSWLHMATPSELCKKNALELSGRLGDSYYLRNWIKNRGSALELAQSYWENHSQIGTVWFQDPEFPWRLNQCPDGPLFLHYKGTLSCWNAPHVISVVGTRKPDSEGLQLVRDIIDMIEPYAPVVVSGLAYGIDAEVHRRCNELNLQNIGVLGSGLDRIYPAQNQRIAQDTASKGALLSEFSRHTGPERENFPQRNRIIAGMTDATILIQSQEKGGGLITAELALDYNRDVIALPGSVYNSRFSGCNKLIQNCGALGLSKIEELPEILGWKAISKQLTLPSFPASFPEDNRELLEALLQGPVHINKLAQTVNKPIGQLSSEILILELEGWIIQEPGDRIRLKQGNQPN